jgi:nucleotide-binding universal stress UspA family protein
MTAGPDTDPAPVLVGVEDVDAHAALRWAAVEAERLGLPLRVLHAYSTETSYPWGYGYPLPAGVLHDVEEAARSNALSVLEDAAERVRDEFPGLAVTTTVARTSAAASLVTASQEACVVVVGRRAHKHPWVAALGSVSLAVAAHAACPVVVVPESQGATPGTQPGTQPDLPFRPQRAAGQVVVGVDDSPESLDAVGFAFAHARAHDLGVVAVHGWWVDPAVMALAEGAEWAEIGAEDEVVVDAILAPWLARYPGVTVSRVVARERPSDALVEAGDGAALLVVGSRGRGGFAGLLLGSVSRQVLQHATCPVAVVRAGQLAAGDDLDVSVHP